MSNKRKILYALFLLAALVGVIFLTLQGPEDTIRLSDTVRTWAENIGYNRTPGQFRSDVHLAEYFIVGLCMSLFVFAMGWKKWIAPVATCLFGLLDETVKIFLPTREFGLADLLKDCIGAIIAFALVTLIFKLCKKDVTDNE